MKKQILTDFITKYNLGGECESVILDVEDGNLKCDCKNESETLRSIISFSNVEMKPGRLGVYNTNNLSKILSALDDDIDISYLENEDEDLIKIMFKDKNIKAEYVLADPNIIKQPEELQNQPPEEISFMITAEMIQTFNKSKSALSEAQTFAIKADNDGFIKLILNYDRENNTDRIEMKVPAKKDANFTPKFYKSDHFKEILNANKNCTRGIMKISLNQGRGIAVIAFQGENFNSKYLLVDIRQ